MAQQQKSRRNGQPRNHGGVPPGFIPVQDPRYDMGGQQPAFDPYLQQPDAYGYPPYGAQVPPHMMPPHSPQMQHQQQQVMMMDQQQGFMPRPPTPEKNMALDGSGRPIPQRRTPPGSPRLRSPTVVPAFPISPLQHEQDMMMMQQQQDMMMQQDIAMQQQQQQQYYQQQQQQQPPPRNDENPAVRIPMRGISTMQGFENQDPQQQEQPVVIPRRKMSTSRHENPMVETVDPLRYDQPQQQQYDYGNAAGPVTPPVVIPTRQNSYNSEDNKDKIYKTDFMSTKPQHGWNPQDGNPNQFGDDENDGRQKGGFNMGTFSLFRNNKKNNRGDVSMPPAAQRGKGRKGQPQYDDMFDTNADYLSGSHTKTSNKTLSDSDMSGKTLVQAPTKQGFFAKYFTKSNKEGTIYDNKADYDGGNDYPTMKSTMTVDSKTGTWTLRVVRPKNPTVARIRRILLGSFLCLVVLGGLLLLILYFTNSAIKALFSNSNFDAPAFNASIILKKTNFVDGADWLGFGTSLAWWARFAGETMYNTTAFENLMDLVFDKDKGMGLSVVRYNLGGTQAYAPGPWKAYADMPAVQLYYGGPYNFDLDKGQRATLIAAMKRGVVAAELFSASPPWWMTKSGSSMGYYDGNNNLDSSNYQLFANYLAQAVIYYRDTWNITFFSVAPFTEPTSYWWKYDNSTNTQEGCHFDQWILEPFLEVLTSTFKNKGLTKMLITGTDEVAYSYTQDDLTSQSLKSVQKINSHGYFDPPNSERQSFGNVVRGRGLKAWMSELGTGGQTMNPTYSIRNLGGIGLARQIVGDIYYSGVTAWVYWQAVDLSGWGLISAPSWSASYFNTVFNPGKQFYTMMQYSRWLRPGMDIIAADEGTDVAVIAGRSAANNSMALVALNAYNFTRTFGVDISAYAVGANSTLRKSNTTVLAFRTSDTEDHKAVTAPQYGSNSVVSISCPPYSVTTVVLWDLTWV
ncbi:hypothetical protein SmJEL517_g04343 [Synchytrium microbalum]|uniref:Endo-beta-1,6-galactanase-like domain-containing protein n=1 Tax=Synchytrium microbalum TaxID=1806994 RepID=A0A507BYM8_9FUNG|nr:uncharacterized protein SmJEL517_g04343 [Synchytrium microbalum]TPX32522.1 hypothetical protein SmJEL517_g04343 [Synchytrium microbalum]